jgi:photosystem II stability/assembly factor-like uncharacterized protein
VKSSQARITLAGLFVAALSPAQTLAPKWIAATSGTTASLRGVSAVNAKIVWASGTEGTWLRTLDGGATWLVARVAGGETLDFRGVKGIDARTAYLMSSGSGDKSRIYKTTDGGSHWSLLLTNPDAEGFFDAIAFWDARHGIVMGDPVAGHAVVMTTDDGGQHWSKRQTPAALEKEGAFAASNSCIAIRGKSEVWFASGGPGAGRVFHSVNGGRDWTVSTTLIRNDGASTGIFSLAFSDGQHGIAVGGDYSHDQERQGNIIFTSDGGATWTAPQGDACPRGYRSAIVYLQDLEAWVVTGSSGSDVSRDGGKSWTAFDDGSFNAISAISSSSAWAVGPKGRIARLKLR